MDIFLDLFHDGRRRQARARDVTTTSIEMVFKVVFDDGYQNTFFIPFGEQHWTEWNRGRTSLAQVVGAAIEEALNRDAPPSEYYLTPRRRAYQTELDHEGILLQLTFVDVSPTGESSKYLVIFADGYENIFYLTETDSWMEQDLGATTLAKQVGRAIRFTLQRIS